MMQVARVDSSRRLYKVYAHLRTKQTTKRRMHACEIMDSLYMFLFQVTTARREVRLRSASGRPHFIIADEMQAIDLLQRVDPGFDVAVLLRR